jgi:hypothetical protein
MNGHVGFFVSIHLMKAGSDMLFQRIDRKSLYRRPGGEDEDDFLPIEVDLKETRQNPVSESAEKLLKTISKLVGGE